MGVRVHFKCMYDCIIRAICKIFIKISQALISGLQFKVDVKMQGRWSRQRTVGINFDNENTSIYTEKWWIQRRTQGACAPPKNSMHKIKIL